VVRTGSGPTIARLQPLYSIEGTMHALAWIGIALLALGILGWLVFKITVWFAVMLFVAGIVFLIWGFTKVKRIAAGGGPPPRV
jgi:membrane-bound ClpP family serine protease